MPEGDTIFRAARTLSAALAGGEITGVQTRVAQVRRLGPDRLVGQQVGEVEPRGKHLLMRFEPSGLVLHTHMRMTGSWHLYRPGQRWRKPERLLTLRLDVRAGDDSWVAAGFSIPVCELLTATQVAEHPSLAALGPDALAAATDLAEARRRLDERGAWMIADALLDQRVLAGVGNVYKCEVLFLHGVSPQTRVAEVPPAVRDRLLATAERLLKRNVAASSPVRVTTGVPGAPRGNALWVYGRARRPCRRCGTPIAVDRLGEQARVTYWCPTCQPAHAGASPPGDRT